jgi:chromosome segregation ATPase
MTPEQRLDQLERILATTIRLTQSNSQAIDRLTERTNANSEAIDRLTERTEANTQAIGRLTERMDRLTQQTEANSQAIDRLTHQVVQLSDIFVESVGIIRTMQTEIRGMQTENQRILRHLFGESEN